MALKIWLPLDGSLRNLGTDNPQITNNGATIDNNGKIGKCYSFDGVDDYIQLPATVIDMTNASFCVWAKWNSFNSWSRVFDFGEKTNGKGYSFLLANSGTTSSLYFGGRGEEGASLLNVRVGVSLVVGQWYHFAITLKNQQISIYVDGELKKQFVATGQFKINTPFNNNYLGRSNFNADKYFNGSINDFRIYDHCLSQKEVKELSQGLILHYKLNGLLGGVGENIILTNSDFSNGTIGWSNWATVQSREIIAIEDKKWAHIVKTANKYGGYSREITIKPNTIYTVSATFYASGATKGILWWHYRSSEGGANLSQNMKSFDLTTTPQRYSAQIPIYTNNNYTVDRLNLMIGTPTEAFGNVNIYFTDIKIEEGLFDTGYIQSIDELGIDTTKIYDSSGYGNDGTVVGNLENETDTERYFYSTVFNGSSCISLTDFYIGNEWSYGCWIYSPISERGWESIILLNKNGGDGDTQLGYYTYPKEKRSQNTANGKYNSGISFTYGQWNHFFGTYDGANLKTYLNGQLVSTTAISSALLSRTNLTIGARSTNENGATTSANYYFNGKLSDVRIYATALDEKAIKKLYNTPTEIDKNHNYHTMELDEIANDISVKKNGKTKAKVFSETTNNNTFFKNGTVNGHFIIEK